MTGHLVGRWLVDGSAPGFAAARAGRALTRRWLGAGWVGLALVTLLGLAVRLVGLWPPSQSAAQAPYDDEGVYVMAAQLIRQGFVPYRDFFFAHPPLGVLSLLPAVSVSYTEWGSSLSFGLARLLMVAMGSLTVLLVGLVAGRCWGTVGGVVAAVVIALDPASVANSRHIMLEVPMTLLIAAALLASAEAAGPGGRLAAGALAGLAGLVKVQAWLLAAAEAGVLIARRRWQELAGLVGGLLIVPLVLAPVLAIAGPGRVLRQLVLFQLLRPPDGLEDLGARLASLLAPSGALIGLLAAPIGLALAWSAGIRSTRTVAPVALWVGLELLSFLVSRSYYGHYASQLTPGLAVLAGGLGAAWTADSAGRRWRRGLVVATGLALTGLALTAVGRAMLAPPDRTFVVVAQYVADAAPPRALVLATDVQFNYLASRPLPHTEAGFLVDSYGQLLFTGLGLDRGGLGEAAGRALAARQGATVYDIMWSAPAQALLRAHAKQAEVVVVHAVGRARLTAETTAWLGQRFQMVESTRRYAIYRRSER